MKVQYRSNNSGGSWWLTDEHWKALEDAGWFVEWGGLQFCHDRFAHFRSAKTPQVAPDTCPMGERNGHEWNECEGHRTYGSYKEALGGERHLGALATTAHKDFPSLADAIREWERLTGMEASDNGCGCCGPPHSFSSDEGYASGEDVVSYLYPNTPGSLREAAKRLAGQVP